MYRSRLLVGILGLLLLGLPVGRAGELPKQITSSVCRTAPEIDGVIGDEEWKDAPPVEFSWKMVRRDQPTTTRECQLRVMNSANGLYIALRVPDSTVNTSLSPFNVDCALVAFSREAELRDGDDRKLVVPGLYVDKHFTKPGKDEDDKQQNGRGAMTHDQDVCSIEWAIPLDSGDAQDLQAKPGDTLRWNLAYFDAFQGDLNGTTVGVAWGSDLDHAADWGSLQLAADVPDDGGRAFKGPEWVETLLQSLPAAVASRVRLTDSALVSQAPDPVAKALIDYTFLDTEGREQTAKAKLYLPASVRDGTTRIPLYYSRPVTNWTTVRRSRTYAAALPSSRRATLKANPLVQTPNPDVALLHIARALPFVDDARVVIGGGSAGGYMTLMLAAETFPLSGAAADVPPVNWGYNAAYFLQRKKWSQELKAADLPVFAAVAPIADQATAVYGDNTDDAIWFRNCPLAQLDTITCPVLVYWSTADMLVPIDQVGKSWVRPFDAQAFPPGFTQDPEKLSATPDGRLRALDVLPLTTTNCSCCRKSRSRAWFPRTSRPRSPANSPSAARNAGRSRSWTKVPRNPGGTCQACGPLDPQPLHRLRRPAADRGQPAHSGQAAAADGSLRRQGMAAHAAEASRSPGQRTGRRDPWSTALRCRQPGACRPFQRLVWTASRTTEKYWNLRSWPRS